MTKRLHGPLAGLVLLSLAPAASAEVRFCGRTDLRLGTNTPWAVAMGDFYPGDGPDLAITFGQNRQLQFWRNDGSGNFTRTDAITEPDTTPDNLSEISDPAAILAADIDADGLIDVVGTNRRETKFFAYTNPGTPGAWGAPADSDSSRCEGNDAVLTDWNGDAALDLVIGQDAGFVCVALGEMAGPVPAGTWGSVTRHNTTATVGIITDVEAGHFLDIPGHVGVPDVLAVDEQYDQLVIWPGDATLPGRLRSDPTELVIIPVTDGAGGSLSPIEAVVGHFNADTNLDALVATTEGVVLFYRGNGTATVFDAPVRQDFVASLGIGDRMPTDWSSMSYVDVSGDGIRDLVITDAGDATSEQGFNWLTVIRGVSETPVPAFDPAAQDHYAMDDLFPERPGSVAIGDVDGDSDLDVVVLHGGRSSLSILRNDGTGTFDAPFSFSAGGRLPRGLDSGHLDGDANEDLVTVLASPTEAALRTAVVLRGVGGDELGPPVALTPPGLDQPSDVRVASVNTAEDATLDILATFSTDQALWEGNGDATFDAPIRLGAVGAVELAQVVGGSAPDLITLERAPSERLRIFEGTGTGSFTLSRTFPSIYSLTDAVVGAFFGTVPQDIVAAGSNLRADDFGLWILPWNAGSGSHDAPVFKSLTPVLGFATEIVRLEAFDIDDVGATEIVAFTGAGEAYVLEVSGTDFILDPVTPYLTFGSSVQDVVIEDLTGDGIEEIAVADRSSIRIREGLGGGTFGPVVTLPSNVDNVGLAAADVDGDGLPELVAASGRTSDLTVFCNASVGSLTLRVGRPFSRDTVHWSDQGAGATFSLASGNLNDLLAQRNFSGATCLTTTAATSYVDARPLPAPAPPTDRSAYYYLVKCSGPECSEPDFGTLSDGRPRFGPASPGAVPDPCP